MAPGGSRRAWSPSANLGEETMKPTRPDLTLIQKDSPAEGMEQLWRQGQQPDVESFLARAGPLTPSQVAAVLRVDQRERWRAGQKIAVETYLERHPEIAEASDAVDLIYNEFLLREQAGEKATSESLVRRFPQFAETLNEQIALHLA